MRLLSVAHVRLAAIAATAGIMAACSDKAEEPPCPAPSAAGPELETVTFTTRGAATSRHTATEFEENDYIYLWYFKPGDVSASGSSLYYFSNGLFHPTRSMYEIKKVPGEILTYVSVTDYVSKNGNELTFNGGLVDYLLAWMAIADNPVELVFTHAMAGLVLDVENAPATVWKVSLLNVCNTCEFDIVTAEMSYSPSDKETVDMFWLPDYRQYAYFLPPINYADYGVAFIEVHLTDGRIYRFGPPEDVEFEMNHAYYWTVDLDGARYTYESARSDAPLNTARLVRDEAQNESTLPQRIRRTPLM